MNRRTPKHVLELAVILLHDGDTKPTAEDGSAMRKRADAAMLILIVSHG